MGFVHYVGAQRTVHSSVMQICLMLHVEARAVHVVTLHCSPSHQTCSASSICQLRHGLDVSPSYAQSKKSILPLQHYGMFIYIIDTCPLLTQPCARFCSDIFLHPSMVCYNAGGWSSFVFSQTYIFVGFFLTFGYIKRKFE